MKRSVIISKCIGCAKDIVLPGIYKSYLTFDTNLSSLNAKFLNIKGVKYSGFLTVLKPNNIIELNNVVRSEDVVNHYFAIFRHKNQTVKELTLEEYRSETELLWHELGSLKNPTLEQIDLYIEILNARK